MNNVINEKQFVIKTMDLGDTVISYYASKRRHKKTLILQHGALLNNISMMDLAKMFRGYNVFVPDFPNHGKSHSQSVFESVESLAKVEYEFIKKLIETEQIEKDADITYAGWSLGGSVGLELALNKEKLFNRIVLISSSPDWQTIPLFTQEQVHDAILQIVNTGVSADVTPERLKWLKENINSMESAASVCVNDTVAARAFDVISKLKDINIPVLMVSGEKDVLALPNRQLTLIDSIPNSKLVLISGEGHAMVMGCPEKVYKEMIEFMSNLQKEAVAAV